jgi:hypothetical protein
VNEESEGERKKERRRMRWKREERARDYIEMVHSVVQVHRYIYIYMYICIPGISTFLWRISRVAILVVK